VKVRGGLLAAAAAAGLSGCYATQQDVLGVAQQTDSLRGQINDLKKTISSMQANQADLSVQIKSLHEDLTAYTETVKASQGDMGQLSTKLDALGAQISGKVTQLGVTISAAQQAQGRETAASQLLLTAQNRLQAKDYEQAAASFEEYLKRFPGGALTDVALYQLGVAYYDLKQWEKAGRQFAMVLDKYPKSGQTPGARLHYAQCLIRLKKNRDEARAYLESVVSDYPKAPEAEDAAAALKRLGPPKRKKTAEQ